MEETTLDWKILKECFCKIISFKNVLHVTRIISLIKRNQMSLFLWLIRKSFKSLGEVALLELSIWKTHKSRIISKMIFEII